MTRAIRGAMVLAPSFIIAKSEIEDLINLAWQRVVLTLARPWTNAQVSSQHP